jgi:hypothetical protein
MKLKLEGRRMSNPNPKNQFRKGNKAARMAYKKPMTCQRNVRVLKAIDRAFVTQCIALEREPSEVIREYMAKFGGWKP